MLKIRLMRIGAKGRPFYRVVVVDERNKRNGAYLDLIGTYNPLTTPKEIKLDMKKVDEWLKKGAQKSDGLLRILKEAPQRHSKPKKEAPEVSKVSEATKNEEKSDSQTSDVKAETAPAQEASEAPAETVTEEVVETASETPVEETTTEAPVEEAPAEEVAAEEPKVEEVVEEEKETDEKTSSEQPVNEETIK